jgi:hypothetical protein
MTAYYCDGIREVTLLNGVARLEFYRLQRAEPGGAAADMQPRTELIVALPAQGFLQALSVLERIRDQLAREGALQTTISGASASSPTSPPPDQPRSRNIP